MFNLVFLSVTAMKTILFFFFFFFNLTDGENYWRPRLGFFSLKSCYDQWCCFNAAGTSDPGGKGSVDIIRVQLDFLLVSVFTDTRV